MGPRHVPRCPGCNWLVFFLSYAGSAQPSWKLLTTVGHIIASFACSGAVGRGGSSLATKLHVAQHAQRWNEMPGTRHKKCQVAG